MLLWWWLDDKNSMVFSRAAKMLFSLAMALEEKMEEVHVLVVDQWEGEHVVEVEKVATMDATTSERQPDLPCC